MEVMCIGYKLRRRFWKLEGYMQKLGTLTLVNETK